MSGIETGAGYDGRGLSKDPKELAVSDALDQGAYVEGYRSVGELISHRPDLADRFRQQALARFEPGPLIDAADDEKE
jgi:hypothetical protein